MDPLEAVHASGIWVSLPKDPHGPHDTATPGTARRGIAPPSFGAKSAIHISRRAIYDEVRAPTRALGGGASRESQAEWNERREDGGAVEWRKGVTEDASLDTVRR